MIGEYSSLHTSVGNQLHTSQANPDKTNSSTTTELKFPKFHSAKFPKQPQLNCSTYLKTYILVEETELAGKTNSMFIAKFHYLDMRDGENETEGFWDETRCGDFFFYGTIGRDLRLIVLQLPVFIQIQLALSSCQEPVKDSITEPTDSCICDLYNMCDICMPRTKLLENTGKCFLNKKGFTDLVILYMLPKICTTVMSTETSLPLVIYTLM